MALPLRYLALLALTATSVGAAAQQPASPPAPGPVPIVDVPPSAAVEIPGAQAPMVGPFDAPAGPPAFERSLPRDTPPDQVERDPSQPVATLSDAIERAYWTNPQLLSERARAQSADFRLPQARGGYGPQVQYSVGYGYRHDQIEANATNTITQDGWTTIAQAVLSQPVFTFGRLRAGEDSARGQIAYQRASLRVAEVQTLLQTVATYVSVLRDRAAVTIARDNVEFLRRQLQDESTLLEKRESTVTDVGQTQSRLELGQAQLLTAQSQAGSSDATFLRYIGAPAGELAEPNPLMMPVRSLEDAYVYADAHNPLLAAAYARERVSRAQLEFAKADLLPRVDLRGDATRGTLSPYSDRLGTTELRGTVTLSGSLDSGIKQSRIGEARATNDADWRLIDEALRENREELADAWNTWQGQQASIVRLQAAVDASQRAFEGGQVQQRAGLRTTTDVLELARDLLLVRGNLNAAMASSYVQQARILAALGALELRYLLPDAQDYDPESHFDRVKNAADFPLLTPVVRAIDSLATPPRVDRPVRDPAGPLAVEAAQVGGK